MMHAVNTAKSRGSARSTLNFAAINAVALRQLLMLLTRWLPDGRVPGHEFVARNPCRADRRQGSFSINIRTGRWADFANNARGGDVISLCAYLFGLKQVEAARRLGNMLRVR